MSYGQLVQGIDISSGPQFVCVFAVARRVVQAARRTVRHSRHVTHRPICRLSLPLSTSPTRFRSWVITSGCWPRSVPACVLSIYRPFPMPHPDTHPPTHDTSCECSINLPACSIQRDPVHKQRHVQVPGGFVNSGRRSAGKSFCPPV